MTLVVVFISLQLTFGRVVERHQNHLCLMYDLPNGATLAKKIVASLIFSVTEILIIEEHMLDSTFLHVTFGSQSLLKPTSNQIGSDTN
jgi:hypothetical protein